MSRFLYCLMGQPSAFCQFMSKMADVYKWNEMEDRVDVKKLKLYYEEWEIKIKREVPLRQLLIYNINEGWGPLCSFLDVPIPEANFPVVNESDRLRKMHSTMKWVVYGLFVAFIMVMLFVGFKMVNVFFDD